MSKTIDDIETPKNNDAPEPLPKAVSRKQAIDAAVRCYAEGDARRARNIIESLGYEMQEDGFKDLLIELAGEACRAVARAILRGRE